MGVLRPEVDPAIVGLRIAGPAEWEGGDVEETAVAGHPPRLLCVLHQTPVACSDRMFQVRYGATPN